MKKTAWLSVQDHLASGHTLSEAVTAVERLWNTLVILDRIGEERVGRFDPQDVERVRDRLRDIDRATSTHLRRLVDYMAGRAADPPDFAAVAGEIAAVEEAIEVPPRFAEVRKLDQSARAVVALRFSLDELRRSLDEVGRIVVAEQG